MSENEYVVKPGEFIEVITDLGRARVVFPDGLENRVGAEGRFVVGAIRRETWEATDG